MYILLCYAPAHSFFFDRFYFPTTSALCKVLTASSAISCTCATCGCPNRCRQLFWSCSGCLCCPLVMPSGYAGLWESPRTPGLPSTLKDFNTTTTIVERSFLFSIIFPIPEFYITPRSAIPCGCTSSPAYARDADSSEGLILHHRPQNS